MTDLFKIKYPIIQGGMIWCSGWELVSAVLKSQRGKGYGLLILKKIIKDISKIDTIKYLHAQIQVVDFYEKVGFKKIGNKFDEVGIMHYKMILN